MDRVSCKVNLIFLQAVLVDRTLYISGQLGMDPDTMELVDGGVKDQAIQALKNMHMILRLQSNLSPLNLDLNCNEN